MKNIKARILSNLKIHDGYFKMGVQAPQVAQSAKPGQFIQIRCSDTLDPFLRRPFSVHRVRARKEIEILYEVVGKGTKILAEKKQGDFIDILGPLGTGFTLPRITNDERRITILIAGGIGVAPLVFLAEELAREKIKTIVLIGTKTRNLILCEKDFKKIASGVHIATQDGTRGHKGLVSGLFKEILRTRAVRRSLGEVGNDERPFDFAQGRRVTIYACGPNAMLRTIAGICGKRQVECQVSLEEKMACGTGACLGCAVKVKEVISPPFTLPKKERMEGFTYKLACKDGPVFNAKQIIW